MSDVWQSDELNKKCDLNQSLPHSTPVNAMFRAAKESWMAGGSTPGVSSTNTRGCMDNCAYEKSAVEKKAAAEEEMHA